MFRSVEEMSKFANTLADLLKKPIASREAAGHVASQAKNTLWNRISPELHRRAGTAASGAAMGAFGGGIEGGTRGHLMNSSEGTEGNIGRLAKRDALIGALAGGVGGAAAPGATNAISRVPGFKQVADYGKRQLHGLTGWKPEAGLPSIGVKDPAKAYHGMHKRKLEQREMMDDMFRRTAEKTKGSPGAQAIEAHETLNNLLNKNTGPELSSIPGVAKHLKNVGLRKGLGDTIKARLSSGPAGAIAPSLAALQLTGASGRSVLTSNKDKKKRAHGDMLRSAANLALTVPTGGLSLTPQLLSRF